MQCQLRDTLVRFILERERDAVVQARPASRTESLVQRLVDQCVDEPEAADSPGRLVQQRRGDRSLQPIEQLALRRPRQPHEQRELERAADHGRKRQDLTRLVPEPVDTAADDVADALRQAQRLGTVDAPPLGRRVVEQSPGFDEAAKDFADEERVAVGLARDFTRQHQPARIQLVAGGRRHYLGHLGRAEAFERDPLDALDAPQIGQHRAQRVILAQIRVAESDDHLEGARVAGSDDVLEQRHRLRVRPVEVVEHETDRR